MNSLLQSNSVSNFATLENVLYILRINLDKATLGDPRRTYWLVGQRFDLRWLCRQGRSSAFRNSKLQSAV